MSMIDAKTQMLVVMTSDNLALLRKFEGTPTPR